jgi:3-hydroxybutyryl-CoA dehydrogenase
MQIQSVGVIGCGIMGHGIAQVAAQAGCDVIACELDQAALDRGLGRIDEQLARAVDRGRLERADADATRGRIAGTLDYGDLAGCDLVIEAITESLEGKLRMWADVDRLVKPEAILASNTSSLPVVEQAARTGRPERFLGLHFFNPPQRMDLIEVIRCVTTSDETFQAGLAFAEQLGKLPVPARDNAGFIVNRLLVPYMLDAIRAYEEGAGSIDQIDSAMKAGAGHPMGPLTLADFIGLDTLGSISEVMFEEFRERRFAKPPTLRQMLAAGWFGRKSGLGFYDYSGPSPAPNPRI